MGAKHIYMDAETEQRLEKLAVVYGSNAAAIRAAIELISLHPQKKSTATAELLQRVSAARPGDSSPEETLLRVLEEEEERLRELVSCRQL